MDVQSDTCTDYLEGVGEDGVGGLGREDGVLYQYQQGPHLVLPVNTKEC
jgi:hypothetical protein